MKFKFILQKLKEDGNIEKEKEFRTLREISDILNIEYHQTRAIYLYNTKKTNLHPFLKDLITTYRIIDNPNNKKNIIF